MLGAALCGSFDEVMQAAVQKSGDLKRALGALGCARCASRWAIRSGTREVRASPSNLPPWRHPRATQVARSSPACVNGKSSLAGAFYFFLAETVSVEAPYEKMHEFYPTLHSTPPLLKPV